MAVNRGVPGWAPITEAAVIETEQVEVTVGTTATEIIKPDPYRVAVAFANPSANQINIGINNGVTTGSGIQLAAGSEPVHFNDDKMPGVSARRFWGIASTGASTLTVIYARLIG